MQQYEVKILALAGNVRLTYDDGGQLCEASCSIEGMTPVQHQWLWSWLPLTADAIEAASINAKVLEKMAIQRAEYAIPFSVFWDTYGYKVGKKTRAENLWEGLTPGEQWQCMRSIPRYKAWLAGKSIERLYPETYLAQRRFENKF